MDDARAYRKESRERWGAAAEGWAAHRDIQSRQTMPVSTWMVDALELQPGARVLELAAGTGDVGFLAHELIQPGGELITSDFSPEMLSAAQRRAEELGLGNVRFKQIDAESIDLDAGSVDGVLCRWGFMLMADPGAALRETRRVLRPGGRVALAAWAPAETNPWSSLLGGELVSRGLMEERDPSAPGQFAWAAEGVIEQRLYEAGFLEVTVVPLDFSFAYGSFEEWISVQTELSGRIRQGFEAAGPDVPALKAALEQAAADFQGEDGSLVFPARTWVAVAEA